MAVAAVAMAQGVHVFVVTLGERGAVYFATGDAAFGDVRRQPLDAGRPVTTGRIGAELVEVLDPTGCGDVFGGALVAELVRGTHITDAVGRANALAGRNVRYRGATKLQYHLRGEIVPT